MRKLLLIIIVVLAKPIMSFGADVAIYLDPNQSVENRIKHLMSLMTLEDKIVQMCQYVGLEHMKEAEKHMTEEELKSSHARGFYKGLHSSTVAQMVEQGKIGSFLHVLTAEEADYLQQLAEKSQLKIPLLIGIDAIHGNGLYRGSTVYPSPLGMASTFDPNLVEVASRQTALEMRATGSHWAFTPNIEIARDPRWGRVGETFGEDPCLVTSMGVASIRGLQTADFVGTDKVIACAKHLVAGGQPVNGTNAAPMDVSENTLRNIFLPPFKTTIAHAKPFTIMAAHHDLNGIPCHGNKWIMNDIAKKEYGFDGFIVSDWMDMEALWNKHKVAKTMKDAFCLSVDAGIDMHMHGPKFAEIMKELVIEGRISEDRINEACSKILEAKFKLGLFEHRYTNKKTIDKVVFSAEHQKTALELARRSIVLLKNDKLLPLDSNKYRKILVAGPNSNNQSIMGDWVFEQPEKNVITILQGIKNIATDSKINFVDVGWNLSKIDSAKIRETVTQAKNCDIAILVVGEDSYRQHWNEKTGGENRDRMDITLWGLQQELVESVYKTGVPTVVILVNGRPLATPWISKNIPAIVEAWEPGSMGGQAVAEVLFGQVNPSGRLPITIPRHVGQIQSVYNYKPSHYSHPVIDGLSPPLYPFGHGLSYSNFQYSNLVLSATEIKKEDSIKVSVDITNASLIAGDEVVQLYIRDNYCMPTRPVKELKKFKRISFKPDEKQTVTFDLMPEDLAYYNSQMKFEVEPGEFTIMVGSSSEDINLLKKQLSIK